jgi:hypothetical protein
MDTTAAATRSSSDPNAKVTSVLPGGAAGRPPLPEANHSRLPKSVLDARRPAVPQPVARIRRLWALSGATAALAILALGAIVWMRLTTPGGEAAPAAKGSPTLSAKSREPGRNLPPPPPIPARAPERGAPPSRTADGSAGSASKVTDPSGSATERPGLTDTGSPARGVRRLRLLVPAYIYPGGQGRSEWRRLIEAASKVDVVAIVNPDSGPGFDRNSDHASVYVEAKAQGIKLIGYISTQYAKRSRAEVKNDIDAWVRCYPEISGFFFDQQPRESGHVDYYAEIRDYAKAKLRDPLVVTNPGILCDDAYLQQAVSGVTCVFAYYEGFPFFELPATLKVYDSSRFAALLYQIPDVESMRSLVKDAILKKIGYFYVTDGKPPNQWGRLPTYWEDEVDAVTHVH